MKHVYFQSWGGSHSTPAYAVRKHGEAGVDAVCRAIASCNKCECLTCRSDGWSGSDSHYQATFGHSLKSGGASPVFQCWISINGDQLGLQQTPEEAQEAQECAEYLAEDRKRRCGCCDNYRKGQEPYPGAKVCKHASTGACYAAHYPETYAGGE